MGKIIDFEAYRKKKDLEKEKQHMREFYQGVDKLIAHLKPQKSVERIDHEASPEKTP
jgi:hypothetical protein